MGDGKYPNFKKKRNRGSAKYTRSGFRLKEGQVFLAKCSGPLPIRWSRPLPEGVQPSTVTVNLNPSGRRYVSVLVEDPTINPLPATTKQIGIDLGLNSLMVTDSGREVRNPRHFNRLRKKLEQFQKLLTKKSKGSRNRQKARVKVARVFETISNCRKDLLHKLSTQLIRENQTVVVEDLCITGMLRSRRCSRSISDASWGEFVRQRSRKFSEAILGIPALHGGEEVNPIPRPSRSRLRWSTSVGRDTPLPATRWNRYTGARSGLRLCPGPWLCEGDTAVVEDRLRAFPLGDAFSLGLPHGASGDLPPHGAKRGFPLGHPPAAPVRVAQQVHRPGRGADLPLSLRHCPQALLCWGLAWVPPMGL
ncbi:MAG: IS200/IS605 family element transposase accessory protein TnpB [Synechococcus sp. SB0665_bin_28]|nr:IS200/IS605 family element transposase accessory protein TnpB [Synechococcus sp. SB0665_bin_28]MYF19469.1 IS200/IS605 family element transposase accessory protein TnpB [Synechococcus sp. SB0677_bin_5]